MIEVPLTEAQFEEASQRLQTAGVNLSGPSGTLSRDGITARYIYEDGVLRIEVVDKPFLLPLSLIESQMRSYIQKGLAQLDPPV